ncbi:PREDICTED: maltase 2 isoform X2 [Rhagoletis zephyria]|nr:PREDICTED: maltase 2 isoform X2 [Rhagoletis zephyria]XP_017464730.1 PREDICTED: maltase 2 isoform X2 [Rhagoletis zephyria]XP_017464731.1 PREDICTED: maltase 2 isoform X2 [Rhagoletis zephyria]
MFANAAVTPTTASPSSDIGSEKLKIPSTAMDMEATAKETSAEMTDIMNDDGAKGAKTESQTDDTATMVMTEMKMSNKENDWWQHMVLYQIYPRSFMDTNGDGVGDLQGIIMKLPHLAETGIDAVWLSPIFKSPMVDFGYDITDFKDIHTEYGTMQDVDKLITESNRLGIKIIMDFVPNHTSNQSEWFEKSINREDGFEDFYIWADAKKDKDGERMPPNNWQSVFYGSAWTWNEKRSQYYLHQFTAAQPDLNFRNPKVVEAMDEILHFWLDKGVMGFRIDAINHLFEDPKLRDEPRTGKTDDKHSYEYTEHIYTKDQPEVLDMLQHWRQLLDDYTTKHGGHTRILMTEAYADLKTLMDYYETEDGKQGAHFPFNFNFITDLNEQSDARDFVFNIQKWLTYMPRGHTANWVMGNHDNARMATRFGPKLVDAMHMLTMTLPGVAVTYNGEEIGMQDHRDITWEETVDPPARNVGREQYMQVTRDPARTPFQWNMQKHAGFSSAEKTWLPVNPNYKNLNLKKQMSEKSHYSVYKALVELRKMPALRKGRFHAEVINRDVFAFEREIKDENSIMTVINIGQRARAVNLTEIFNLKYQQKLTVLVAGSKSTHETGEVLPAEALPLAPYEGLVCMLE